MAGLGELGSEQGSIAVRAATTDPAGVTYRDAADAPPGDAVDDGATSAIGKPLVAGIRLTAGPRAVDA